MKWEDFARLLTDTAEGNGKCQFAAIHSLEDGACLGKHPKDAQGVMELLSFFWQGNPGKNCQNMFTSRRQKHSN